jgi:PAS domain S-box-containing protein
MSSGARWDRRRFDHTGRPESAIGPGRRRSARLADLWSDLPALTQVTVIFGFGAIGCVVYAAAMYVLNGRSTSDFIDVLVLVAGVILSLTVGIAVFHSRKRETERLAMAASRRELEQILEAANRVGIIATDSDGVIQQFNTGAEWMLGFEARTVVGRQTPLVFHLPAELESRAAELSPRSGPRIEGFEALVADAHDPDVGERLWTLRCRDGRSIRASVSVSAVRDGREQTTGYLFVARDVTREQHALSGLQEAKRVAEQANETKSRFVANISHEIRTPMTAILGYADLLEDEALDSGTRLEYVRTIRRNGDHLLAIINDILDMERIASGKLPVEAEDTPLPELVREVTDLMRVRADAKGLPIEIDVGGSVPRRLRTDGMRLRQILMNLLGNAIKFTDAGCVRLTIGEDAAAGGRRLLAIRVADTGVGIRSEQLDRLFEPFTQADSTSTRRHGGSGLGLAISRRLARLLGGDLLARSVYGEGSVFTLTLPLEGASDAAPSTMLSPTRDGPAATSAAVASDPAVRILLSEAPRREGSTEAAPVPLPAERATAPAAESEGAPTQPRVSEPKPGRPPRRRGLEALLDDLADGHDLDRPAAGVDRRRTTDHAAARTPPPSASTATRTTPRGPLSGCRILLAEDGPDNRRLLGIHLDRAGAELTTCEDGQQAVDRLSREGPERTFDLVLMDMQMPRLDGYEATRQLRTLGFRRPIIALTAHASTNDRERCLACGCDDYASKPIDAKALVALCQRWMSTEASGLRAA